MSHQSRVRIVAMAGLVILLLQDKGWGQILSWGLQCDGIVGATCCGSPTNQSQTADTGQLQQLSVSTNLQVSAAGINCLGQQSGFGQVDGTATLGILRAFASATATDATGGACGSGLGTGSGEAIFYDALQITSDTLPVGTQVEFHVTIVLLSSASVAGRPVDANHGTANAHAQLFVKGPAVVQISNDVSNPVAVSAGSGTFSAAVGEFVTLKGVLGVQASVDTSPNYSSVTATSDATQGAFFYIDPITTGASYTTSSGHGYFTPPPKVLVISNKGAGATVSFTTIPTDLYNVQSRDDLNTGSWSTMASNLVATNAVFPFLDLTATNVHKRFYRVNLHF